MGGDGFKEFNTKKKKPHHSTIILPEFPYSYFRVECYFYLGLHWDGWRHHHLVRTWGL